ncbi:hybrid sensor histidine kinase/response regulator [Roseivirga pacifica]
MKTILVVEDNELLRENICEILELEGYDVACAQNGQVGAQMALKNRPDLIISDINMPIMDGMEMLKELRSKEESKTIPFIFLTVKNTMKDLRDGMNLGADDYLTKPFDMVELTTAVKNRLDIRERIIAKEVDKFDKLKSVVGLPIASVIDDPLRNIERLAEMLSSEKVLLQDQEEKEIAGLINKKAAQLRKMIVKILYFYRIEALKNHSEDLNTLKQMTTEDLHETIRAIGEQIAEENGRTSDLQLHLEETHVQFPQEFIEFAIKELVSNAFKYSSRNCPVKISGLSREHEYDIMVIDQGIGFSDTNLEEIEPFINPEQTSGKDGIGIGLYTLKTLADLFDVELSLVSEEGVGSSFTMVLKKA